METATAVKFTFKTEKPTGRYRAFSPTQYLIKLGGKEVGNISDDEGFKVSLAVKKGVTDESRVPFKWIRFKKEFQSLDEAKMWLNENAKEIIEKHDIYKFD